MSAPNLVDMSNWGGPLTLAEAQCMRDAGILGLMVGTGPGDYGKWAGQQADMGLSVGMALFAYHYLEWAVDPEDWVRAGVVALGAAAKHVIRGFADVEHPNDVPPTIVARVMHVAKACTVLDNAYELPGGISTGRWYWTQDRYMANTASFSQRALHNAYYDEDSDISGLPYGGWTQADVEIEQFGGTRDLCGQSVDINYWYKVGEEMSQLEDLIISVYRDPGMEDSSHDDQLANAQMRMAQRLTQRGSINDQLISHLTVHPGPSDGSTGGGDGATSPHKHGPADIPHMHPSVIGGPIPSTVGPA